MLNLAVEPASRRARRVASASPRSFDVYGKGEGYFLKWLEPNLPAIALYEHHGWVRNGVRKGYYSGGNVNAIVMVKSP